MLENIHVSGFSDEISSDFKEQLNHVTKLGMSYISLRGIDKKNINDYSIDEINSYVKPTLDDYKVSVSSIGSPIGKVFIDDEDGFIKQKEDLERLCQIANILDSKYMRIFSFYIPKDKNADDYHDEVISKLKEFVAIAEKYDIVLLHENEKDIFGDTDVRCLQILEGVDSEYFKAIFDFANFVQVNVDPMPAYKLLEDEIVYIHIKDALFDVNENVLCGTGDGNIKEILKDLISKGYKGFLTLEPHLVMFDSLQDLELEAAADVIKTDKAKDGAEGYKMQYDALLEILKEIEGEI